MQTIEHNYPSEHHGLTYTAPVGTWDEAIPLGNGIMGALVWGDGHPFNISLDRADLWDQRPVPEFHSDEYSYTRMRSWEAEGRVADLLRVYEEPYNRPAPTKIPAGRIELQFGERTAFARMSLRLREATAHVTFDDGTELQLFMHALEPVGMLRIQSYAELSLRLVAPPFSGDVRQKADGGIRPGDLAQLGYPPTYEASGTTWRAFSQQGADGFHFAAFVAWREQGGDLELAWSVASSFEGDEPLDLARARVGAALGPGFDHLLTTHCRWWEAYWRQSSLRLPNAIIDRQWYLEQYKFGSASRRGAPPITLQGPWTADDGQLPPWKGDYHHDLNTQLSYWPCYSGNHLEEGLSYLDWLWQTRPHCFAWTERFFGLPGLNVPMTADLDNNQIGGWRQYTHSATTASWLAHHFYLHWRYSMDRTFLRERAYPYLKDAAVFVEAVTAERDADGLRTLPLSSSPEINNNRPEAWFPTITNYDLALIRWLLGAAAELADELDLGQEALHWRTIMGELPDFAHGEDGRLLVTRDYPLQESHRHFSHLMAIHPLGLLDMEHGPSARRTIQASLTDLDQLGTDWWCGYSFAWLASLAARAQDGAAAEAALTIFASAFTLPNSFHCNGDQSGLGYSKFTYRPFTLEGNFAAAAGIQEMLLQSHGGQIRIFPAIPETWRDVSFTTLRAQGAFLVSARRANGVTEQVEIVAEQGGICRLQSPFSGAALVFSLEPGASITLQEDP